MDLHLLPLHRREGIDQPDLPGLFVADAGITRKPARSRKGDLLVLALSLEGTATIPPEGQAQVLETLAQTYFESSGSVTMALTSAAETLNDFLLTRNREGAASSLQATGLFTGLLVHGGQLYTIQSGPTHVFTIHAVAAQAFHDPLLAGRGLGLGRKTETYLNHAPLQPGDLIIISPAPPPAWNPDALQKAYGRSMHTIHRVLMNAAGDDLQAVLIQVHPGKGEIRIRKTDALDSAPPLHTVARTPEKTVRPAEETGGGDAQPVSSLRSPSRTRAAPPPAAGSRPGAGQALLAVLRAAGSALKAAGYSLRSALSRVLPGRDLFTIPASTMAFIAVAVPVLVVAVAGVVYVQRGRQAQYDAYLARANEFAAFAAGRTDPNEIRVSWVAVLDYVDLAETYQATSETQELRAQAYAALDPLDGIERLDFQPALITVLDERVNIVRMVANRDELYMLDSNSGSVIRAFLTGRGYEVDPEFKCGSFGNTTYSIGKLIDLAALPLNNTQGADVFAMDGDGNVLYCKADGTPPFAQAIAPPNSNWGDPRSFVLDSGALYVLDPQTNAVWIYGGADFTYVKPPRLFFDEQVPPMAGVIDFAVDLADLYLLYEDGHLTTCVFGFAGQSTRCTDPALFTDTRPGREAAPFVAGAQFSQIRFSPPPDSSIYLLDPAASAVYHYSLRLTFQRQFRPIDSPEAPATAFTISSGRMLFLAYGNEVFWSVLP